MSERPSSSRSPSLFRLRIPLVTAKIAIVVLVMLGVMGGGETPPSAWAAWCALLGLVALWNVVLGLERSVDQLLTLLAALPLAALVVLGQGGHLKFAPLPGWAWWLTLALPLLVRAIPTMRVRERASRVLLTLLSASVVMAITVGGLRPVARAFFGASPSEQLEQQIAAPDQFALSGIRNGSASPDGAGVFQLQGNQTHTQWRSASRETHPGPRPVVLDLGAPRASPERSALTVVPASAFPLAQGELAIRATDLEPFDAVWCPADAWSNDSHGKALATAFTHYVYAGGTLLVPTSSAWAPRLREALGDVQRVGLGHVVASTNLDDGLSKLAASSSWLPSLRTVFYRAQRAPHASTSWGRWTPNSAGRGRLGLSIVLYLIALFLLHFALRGATRIALATAVAAVLAVLALLFVLPEEAPVHVEAARFELARGSRGLTSDVIWMHAGPEGFRGSVKWADSGFFRMLGGALAENGDIVLHPGAGAWLVRQSPLEGFAEWTMDGSDAPESGDFLLEMLKREDRAGEISSRTQRAAVKLPVSVEGVTLPLAWRVRSVEAR